MHRMIGNLWLELEAADLILVTTNATIRVSDGALVMGQGAALQAKQRFHQLPFVLGDQLRARGLVGCEYNLLPGIQTAGARIGAFQVKYHWNDAADLKLIEHSVAALAERASRYKRIVLNYPGVGNGQLGVRLVAPLLEPLPDNVYVYSKEGLDD